MVTRNIKADTATQVNANLIGVQVRPATSPITYNVKGVVVPNYKLDYVVGYGYVQLDGEGNWVPAESGNNCFSANDGGVYYYNGLSTYDGEYTETTLWHYSRWGGDGSTVYYVAWNTLPEESNFDRWKDQLCVWDGQGKPNFSDAPKAVHCFVNHTALILNSNGNIKGYYGDEDSFTEELLVDGNNLYAYSFNMRTYSETAQVELYFNGNQGSTGGNTYNEMKGTFDGGRTVFGYTMGGYDWVPEDKVVKVGDTVYKTLDDLNFGVYSAASLIDVSTGGGKTDPVDCTLSYSVDGTTWTAWEKNLTDDNNVIANIPRYMYLKFGQDVEITEE